MTHRSKFAHRRLDAFRIAMELTLGVEELAEQMPRGYADLKDQVRRAASATARNIAEGANRWTPRDKAARYVLARGECGECDAALEMIAQLLPSMREEAHRLSDLAYRVAAMLTALIRAQERRT